MWTIGICPLRIWTIGMEDARISPLGMWTLRMETLGTENNDRAEGDVIIAIGDQ